jgi:hypothetical protein
MDETTAGDGSENPGRQLDPYFLAAGKDRHFLKTRKLTQYQTIKN